MNRSEKAMWYFLLILVVLLLTIVSTTGCSSMDNRTCVRYDRYGVGHRIGCDQPIWSD
jgi:hypothetical protein